MALMGQREYARHRGCALRAVQKAIEGGRIKLTQDGARMAIDSEQADRDWQANTDPAKQSLLYEAGPKPPPASAAASTDEPADEDLPAADAETSSAYREARAGREKLRLERDQFEFAERRGELIDVVEAKRLAFTAFRTLRDSVLNVPARVKDQLAALTDALEIEQLLDAELAAALSQMDPAKVLAETDSDDDDDAN